MKIQSTLSCLVVLLCASAAGAQMVEPAPMTPAEQGLTSISKVFESEFVGASATFVDPVAACVRMYASKVVSGGTVNCKVFRMGSPESEKGRYDDEVQHVVELTKPFEIQATEVTQLQWLMVMAGTDRSAPSSLTDCMDSGTAKYRIDRGEGDVQTVEICPYHPVEAVTYEDIAGERGFLARLNASQSKYTYRLPTEAEWEYSARGGQLKPDGSAPRYFFGDYDDQLAKYAIYDQNSRNKTGVVASLGSNPYGLYDVYGNVSELVEDFYEKSYGLNSEALGRRTRDPKCTGGEKYRTVRGGSFINTARHLRSAMRIEYTDFKKQPEVGFRLVRVPR